jgi:3-deoxy-manno-octulosonate cytidylyltransferase (CMP-KDO synthetase)
VLIIPARYSSTRLPGKPLIKIKGIPMIIRTCKQCLKVVPAKNLYVATDDKKVEKCCKEHGIQTIMTSKKCLTGTDRVAEVAKKIKSETYINVQGDEPIFNPIDLKKIINSSKINQNIKIEIYQRLFLIKIRTCYMHQEHR